MKYFPLIVTILVLLYPNVQAQQSRGDVRILFYNVENLFDFIDDPEIIDEEFLPGGDRHWTKSRFNKKLANLAKVLVASGGWQTPEIIGLCEVENRFVLEQLIKQEPLQKSGYKIIHKDSPDERGIDVALLYQNDKFLPLNYSYIPLTDEQGAEMETREILYVSGIIGKTDTVHLFINHWPSRYSGTLETVELRNRAARILQSEVEGLVAETGNPQIIIMGDFNDQPTDKSITEYLKAKSFNPPFGKNELINLSSVWSEEYIGTIKYLSQWFIYDQVIISSNLLHKNNSLFSSAENASNVKMSFLLSDDLTYGGLKPFRTYNGFNYQGGFSDHLPVYLDLFFK